MAGKLISFPLRASLRSAQIVARAVSGVAGRALEIPGRAIRLASSGRSSGVEHDPDRTERNVAPRPAPPINRPPAPHAVADPPLAPAASPEPPTHVSEGLVLVREEADPGAEEGAGAAITVAEPWNGYGHMNARDLIDRVPTATVAELAAMRLYEARHRARRTVLAAVDRQLKLAASGRPA
jgi:hypothetical protein